MIQPHAMRLSMATALVAVTAGGAWLLRTFDPNSPGSFFPACLFRELTGLFCPGCGITRMLHALAHGDVVRAFEMNPLLLLMLPALVALAVHELGSRRILPAAIATPLYNAKLWIGALLAFGVIRNLPWAPFAALAPG